MIKVRAVQSLVFQAVISAWFVGISGGGAIGAATSACSISSSAAGAGGIASGYIWNLVNDWLYFLFVRKDALYNFAQKIEMCLYNWDTRKALYD
jgi:hypothetical protein